MTAHTKLTEDVKAWRAEKTLPAGPDNMDSFILEATDAGWTLHIRPLTGIRKTLTGLTPGEANRARMLLCGEGFIGKVIGGAL